MNLTQAALYTKRFFIAICIGFAIFMMGFISYRIWYYFFDLPNRPKVVVPPDIKFGTLPRPVLPKTLVASESLTYTIDTETGNLPTDFTDRANIYFIPQLGTTLLAPNRARELAESINFKQGPDTISPTLFRYNDGQGGEIIIDLNSGNFRFSRKIDETLINKDAEPLGAKDRMVDELKGFLDSKGLLKDALKAGRGAVQYNANTSAQSSSAIVSIWPATINNLAVVTPNYQVGLIKAVVTKGAPFERSYTRFDYIFWEPDITNFATYPLRTVSSAFEDLKAGKGIVVQEPGSNRASINNVYLAYFEPADYAKYIQPVYVFEGANFAAYVLALPEQYLEK